MKAVGNHSLQLICFEKAKDSKGFPVSKFIEWQNMENSFKEFKPVEKKKKGVKLPVFKKKKKEDQPKETVDENLTQEIEDPVYFEIFYPKEFVDISEEEEWENLKQKINLLMDPQSEIETLKEKITLESLIIPIRKIY